MKITIELLAGPHGHKPTKEDIDRNIEAIERAIEGKPLGRDFIVLNDTKSILEGIKRQLPGARYKRYDR